MSKDDLIFNFSEKYGEEISEFEDKIYQSASSIGGTGVRWMKKATKEEIQNKITLCNECIEAFNTFKDFCYKKGSGGKYYFQDMWEHLHNSRNKCFSYVDDIIETKRSLEIVLLQK